MRRVWMLVFALSVLVAFVACDQIEKTNNKSGDGGSTDGDGEDGDQEETAPDGDADPAAPDGDTEQMPDGEEPDQPVDGDWDSDEDHFPDGDGDAEVDIDEEDGDIDTEWVDGDQDTHETESETDLLDGDLDEEEEGEEELDCVRGEMFCACLPGGECLDERDICRDGICEYCSLGHHLCPCHGTQCLDFLICHELRICLYEEEIDIVCPGGRGCPCNPDGSCDPFLSCRLGEICLDLCSIDLGGYGCPCLPGNYCMDHQHHVCRDGLCVPRDWEEPADD